MPGKVGYVQNHGQLVAMQHVTQIGRLLCRFALSNSATNCQADVPVKVAQRLRSVVGFLPRTLPGIEF